VSGYSLRERGAADFVHFLRNVRVLIGRCLFHRSTGAIKPVSLPTAVCCCGGMTIRRLRKNRCSKEHRDRWTVFAPRVFDKWLGFCRHWVAGCTSGALAVRTELSIVLPF